MATYYWVGGSGNWDATSTTNWATSSGGTGGAGVPTSVDDVIFDANSNVAILDPFTVTVTGTSAAPAVCNDFSTGGAGGALDGAMTLSQGATSVLDIYGSLTLPATNFTWSGTSGNLLRFRATTTGKTITTNGVTIGGGTNSQLIFDGNGGEWGLSTAINVSGSIVVTQGTFKTNDFNVTAGINFTYVTSTQLTRAIYLGSSTVTFGGTAWGNFSGLTATNITFDAGTSQINCSNTSFIFGGGGLTYHNVSFTSTGGGVATITGANTYNNLTFTSPAATGIRNISVGANQTVNGTLTFGTANTAIRRMFMYSDVVGTSRTITLNGSLATLADVDFRNITAAGTAGTWTGTRLGNCLGNSNITFDAGKTVYWNLNTSGNAFEAVAWAATSGGAPNVNNFPLAQDTAIFENAGVSSGGVISSSASWNLGTVSFSTRTLPMTIAFTSTNFYGNLTYSSAITISGTQGNTFCGQGVTQTITSAGKTITYPITINNVTGTVQLQDALITSNSFTLTQGTLDLNNFDLTCLTFSSSNSNTRSILFGTGNINVTGNATNSLWVMDTATNFTLTGEPNVNFTYSGGTGTRSIRHATVAGGSESNAINVNITAGTDIVNLALDANKPHIKHLNYTGFSGSTLSCFPFLYGDLIFSSAMTLNIATTLNLTFASAINEQKVTFNGKTADWWFIVNTTNTGLVKLLDNMTIGSTRNLNHISGTLDLNDNTLTAGVYSTTGSTTRQIDFGTGDLNITGASFTASGSNFTTAGTGSVSMNSASSKTFAGGGFTYTCALNQGGSGTLVITGANTFADITNTNATASTITFPNTNTSVSAFSAEGTAGNLLTLSRTGASGTFTLAYTGSSRVDSDYLSISNSEATPSNTWYAGDNSTDGGGNTGWTFIAAPILVDSNIQRLAELGSVIVGQSKQTSTASRLGGAGQIEADIVRYKTQFSSKVSGLTVKGRLINKARE